MRLITRLALATLLFSACGDRGGGHDAGVPCTGNVIEQCEAQCGGGPSRNICYPDPVGPDGNGCFTCFCQACVPDMAHADLAAHD